MKRLMWLMEFNWVMKVSTFSRNTCRDRHTHAQINTFTFSLNLASLLLYSRIGDVEKQHACRCRQSTYAPTGFTSSGLFTLCGGRGSTPSQSLCKQFSDIFSQARLFFWWESCFMFESWSWRLIFHAYKEVFLHKKIAWPQGYHVTIYIRMIYIL